jgi:hypothetical protein
VTVAMLMCALLFVAGMFATGVVGFCPPLGVENIPVAVRWALCVLAIIAAGVLIEAVSP